MSTGCPARARRDAVAVSEQDAAIFTVAAFTGLRLGELRALRWADVDFVARTIIVRRNAPVHGGETTPKSGRVRSVPLIDQAALALDGLSRRHLFTRSDDRVFPSPTGGVLDDNTLRDRFYLALETAGLGHLREKDPPIVFHDLRHSFGTLGAAIWPLHDLQGYMGHSDISTTMIYVHHVPKIAAAEELSRAVAAAMGADTVDGCHPAADRTGASYSVPPWSSKTSSFGSNTAAPLEGAGHAFG